MKAKIVLCSLLGLVGISAITFAPKITTPNSMTAALATTPKKLPPNLETAVREKMAQQLEINSKSLKLTKTQVANWADCLPDKSSVIPPVPCKKISRSGWRVTMSGQGENWVYYITNNGFITLDATASLNNNIISNLSKQLGRKPNQLRIISAQITKGLPPCPVNATCKVKPILGWRILVKDIDKPFFLSLDGKDLNYGNLSLYVPEKIAGMPRNIAEKVLADVVSRHDQLISNLKVESFKSIKWNWCGSGGPTKPEMGNCPNVEIESWQMTVISGNNRYVYYIAKNDIASSNFYPQPDGIQSLSNSLVNTIKKDAAKRAKVPENMINVRFAKPKFFDRCLNIDNEKLNCRQSITAGWEVQAIGGDVPKRNNSNLSGASATWIYHVNLQGNDIRFLQSGVWTPVP